MTRSLVKMFRSLAFINPPNTLSYVSARLSETWLREIYRAFLSRIPDAQYSRQNRGSTIGAWSVERSVHVENLRV